MSATHDTERGTIRLVELTSGTTSIDLEGEFDLNEASTILEHARRILGEGRHVIVNLNETTFIDSSIIHALFNAGAAAQSAGREMVVQLSANPAVERVLSITKADTTFTRAASRDEALHLIERFGTS